MQQKIHLKNYFPGFHRGIITMYLLIWVFTANAQNLVVNPSFETFSSCPTWPASPAGDAMTLATGWQSANRMAVYCNACAGSDYMVSGVPKNVYGHQQAATGNAYVGMCVYIRNDSTARPMFSGTLSTPLVVGNTYTVSYKVSLAGESSTIAINKLGADFSVNNPGCFWGGTLPAPSCIYPPTNTPDLFTSNIINDSSGWTTLSWNFIATEPSKYIIIGVFHSVAQEQLIYNPNSGIYPSYYYFDDVSVVENNPCTLSITNTESCVGQNNGTATATVTSGAGPFTYTWDPAPGSGQGTPFATGLSSQPYTLTVSNAEGTCGATTIIDDADSIALNLEIVQPSCGTPGSASVNPTGGNGPYNYNWDGAPGATSVNLPAGTHEVLITDLNGCTNSRIFELIDDGLPVTITPLNPGIAQGDSVQLTASGGITYTWTPSEGLSCTNCANPYASPLATTVYTVTATNADGCSGSAAVTVKVNCSDIFVPTIFSPNGDGQNEDICVLGGCITRMVFTIYNRWGEKVFETTEQNACWDGYFKGNTAESGAYVYRLQAVMKDGQQIQQSGNITIVR